jgi:hypothetical protein
LTITAALGAGTDMADMDMAGGGMATADTDMAVTATDMAGMATADTDMAAMDAGTATRLDATGLR